VVEKDKKMHLVDCPGYLDTFGFYRIVGNRFFHYQVFQKVVNVKFIITFTHADIRKSADVLKDTFREFLSGFSNLSTIKDDIINATSALMTNVPRDLDKEELKKNFQQTSSEIGENLKSFY
jgi:hypothetical protein